MTSGTPSGSSPGSIRARRAATGGRPRTSPGCRPGSSRRSAARRSIGPARACASRSTSGRRALPTGRSRGANLLDWPIDGAEMAPWYEKAEAKLGVTRTGDRPGLPGNDNYKVLEAGAKALGYKEVHTGRMAINAVDYDDRMPCQQTGFCFQSCKWGRKMVGGLCRHPARRADRQPRGARPLPGAPDRARGGRARHRGGLCRQGRTRAAPGGEGRLRRRQLDGTRRRTCSRTGSPTPRGRSGQLD
jgi:hypothetical protein